MGSADNRAAFIQKAVVVEQERTALVISVSGNVAADFFGLLYG
jgi:hypothetical protein